MFVLAVALVTMTFILLGWCGLDLAVVIPCWLIPLCGLSGKSLLLGVPDALGALVGLLALSSPRQARPEPYPTGKHREWVHEAP